MAIHNAPRAILCGVGLVVMIGCSGPVAPSSGSATAGAAAAGSATTAVSPSRFGDRMPGTVYVTSQGLYYDTFATADPLPMKGRFQRLENGQTEFGPGQPGYLGGRWWVDLNGNDVQDSGDHFFLCPLLPPGRPTP